ncbi:unnamed protein product [Sphenostylis stenocarpa]|uniref:Uncharacterized protein n=1 Tax=Sphenostylis stenocarpa TaxID=92480 RepID=A0AA86SI17_9FABA|nr:unnamed protein product [Sphenostylis stenocarpa]
MVKSIFECNPITLSLSRQWGGIESYMDEQWNGSLEEVYLRERKKEWGREKERLLGERSEVIERQIA